MTQYIVKCPEITVKLTGLNGNAFVILGAVKKELKKGGYDAGFIDNFMKEATSGNYDHLLKTVINYVNIV